MTFRTYIMSNKWNTILKAMLFVPLLLSTVGPQEIIPSSPCPEYFQYRRHPQMGVTGHITLPNNAHGQYDFNVNVSFSFNKKVNRGAVKLNLLTPHEKLLQGVPIEFDVIFSVRDTVPKLTLISLNDDVKCTGYSEPFTIGGYVTNVWSSMSFRSSSSGYQDIGFTEPKPIKNPFLPDIVTNIFFTTTTQPPAQKPEPKPQTTELGEKCGVISGSQHLIFGGEKAESTDVPWLTAIMYKQKFTYKFKCTGNLISRQHVVTAGHCVRYYEAFLFEFDSIIIVLGKSDIENWAHNSVIRNVKSISVHPNYKQNNADSDVAVIFLNEPITFETNVFPICFSGQPESMDNIVDKEGVVIGWGKSGSNEDYSPKAMKISIPVVSQEQCLRSHKVYRNLTTSNTFCAGKRDGTGPCTGDSGAGFIIKNTTTNQWYLRGLVSFGLRDPETLSCDLNNYIIFADIAKLQSWILSVVRY